MAHPVMVARILAEMRMDLVAMQTGLLHDVVEDTSVTVEQVRKEFGEEVARCVDGVTKLTKLDFFSAEDRQAESVRKMLLAMVEDIRVIMVKLADRIHNMRTLSYLEPGAARSALRARPSRSTRPSRTAWEWARCAANWRTWPSSTWSRTLTKRSPAPSRSRRHANEEFLDEVRRTVEAETAARSHSGAHRRAREAALLGVPEDAAAEDPDRPGLRPDGAAHHHRFGEELLRRAGRDPQRVAAHPGPHQGLHRHSASQPLPVAAHLRGGPAGPDVRSADPHRGDAPHRGGRHRRPLEIQRGPQGSGGGRSAHRLAAAPGGVAARGAGPRRVHVHAEGGPVPGRGLYVHAQRAR